MNFLAHTWVARACGLESPPAVLGAVLPDMVTMAGIRLDRGALVGEVAAGVACHHLTDAAFHREPGFVAGSKAITRDLLAMGVPRGASRAVGHVGWELLLDGALLRTPTEGAFHEAMALAEEATGAVRPEDRARWRQFLTYRTRPPSLHYDDPVWVADRLVGILAGSPRLRLPQQDAPHVAAVLAIHLETVAEAGPDVLSSTAAAVRART